jgi:hypothetical protein
MSNFDVAAHLKSNVYSDSDVTEAPESLTVESDDGTADSYYLAPLEDGSSLLWIYLTSDTFNEFLPGYSWSVDDPGTLYAQTTPSGEPVDDEGEPLVPISVMQPVAEELLKRYRAVVEHLRAEGREIEEA